MDDKCVFSHALCGFNGNCVEFSRWLLSGCADLECSDGGPFSHVMWLRKKRIDLIKRGQWWMVCFGTIDYHGMIIGILNTVLHIVTILSVLLHMLCNTYICSIHSFRYPGQPSIMLRKMIYVIHDHEYVFHLISENMQAYIYRLIIMLFDII